MQPEARSVFGWIKAGWHIIVAYILGFFVLLFLLGWQPLPYKKKSGMAAPHQTTEQLITVPASSN